MHTQQHHGHRAATLQKSTASRLLCLLVAAHCNALLATQKDLLQPNVWSASVAADRRCLILMASTAGPLTASANCSDCTAAHKAIAQVLEVMVGMDFHLSFRRHRCQLACLHQDGGGQTDGLPAVMTEKENLLVGPDLHEHRIYKDLELRRLV